MGASKTEEFSVRDKKLARYAKAMGHPARIAILRKLAADSGCQCGDIVDEIPLSQSTVSQHLKELRDAGLIHGDIEGTRVCYCINEKEWKAARQYFSQLWESRISSPRCD